jgi:hypothetical protein
MNGFQVMTCGALRANAVDDALLELQTLRVAVQELFFSEYSTSDSCSHKSCCCIALTIL